MKTASNREEIENLLRDARTGETPIKLDEALDGKCREMENLKP